MTFPVVMLTLLSAATFLGVLRRRSRGSQENRAADSPVARQHWQLYRGGTVNPHALETVKSELRELLDAGRADSVARTIEPGPKFLVQVRALAEIGTSEAATVLERQLHRRHSTDLDEQCWYWIDLSRGLRELNRCDCLPTLLRLGEEVLTLPAGHLFAAEMLCFPNFAQFLDFPLAVNGQAALRVLLHAFRGIRQGHLPLGLCEEARLGDAVARLVAACPGSADPLVTCVFLEVLRLSRRTIHLALGMEEPHRRQSIRMQLANIDECEPVIREYLHDIDRDLARTLDYASAVERGEILQALLDLRANPGRQALAILSDPRAAHRHLAIRSLRWSNDRACFAQLLERAAALREGRTSKWWLQFDGGESSRMDAIEERRAIMFALRGFPAAEAEMELLLAGRMGSPEIRAAALDSLGWWEPIERAEVLNCLHVCRLDADPAIRQSATLALARLGEVAALQQLRDCLRAESRETVHETIERCALGGLSWLWSDLDELTEGDDCAIAMHACDALERMREEMFGVLS